MIRRLSWPCLVLGMLGGATHAQDPGRSGPNVVLFFTDDQGYGDLSCQGHPTIRTPRLDRLAAEGCKLTQFYVAAPLCTPSRAALLTGCYPKRVSMHRHVIFPGHDHGLHTDEVTLADLLRERGYATGCFGKWHLGHRPGLLPLDQGFDVFAGVPYSNDMAQYHRRAGNDYQFRLPWMAGNAVVEWEPDQHLLTRRTTDAVLDFIAQNRARAFFAYVPYAMPHVPIYASPEFEGRSPRGRYGDVIEEIDHDVGRVLDRLDALGLRDDTIVIFAADNGPWLPFKLDGGSAGPLRGGKGTNHEGGQRVPFLVRWPGQVPAGSVCSELSTAMDVLPTLAAIVGAPLPQRAIDGRDVGALWRGAAGAKSPTAQFLYYTGNGELAGVRRGPWKLLLGGGGGGADGSGAERKADALYQVEHDVGEQWDVAAKHTDLVAELRALAQRLDAELEAAARPTRVVPEQAFDPRRFAGQAGK
jgi:arylsulfatase A